MSPGPPSAAEAHIDPCAGGWDTTDEVELLKGGKLMLLVAAFTSRVSSLFIDHRFIFSAGHSYIKFLGHWLKLRGQWWHRSCQSIISTSPGDTVGTMSSLAATHIGKAVCLPSANINKFKISSHSNFLFPSPGLRLMNLGKPSTSNFSRHEYMYIHCFAANTSSSV